jgi:formylglycine-generating enzyme required for sulfatase activity
MADSRSRVSIVILDACRDNPFARSFRSTNRGLAVLPAPSGTFIAYATGPGSVAADGTGRNGLFTGELLRVMREPGLTIEGTFKRVVSTVRQQTADRQVPWTLSSLDGDFIFALPSSASAGGKPPVPVVLAPPPPKLEGHEEIRQELGSLALTSPVAGVEVWLDDQKIWTTRPGAAYVLSNVLAGARRLTARKAGYRDWEREIQLAANQRVDVVIDIEALGPAKTIRNERDDAEMVLVPAGEFWMGSDAAEVERFKLECQKSGGSEEGCRKWGNREAPRHRVYLDAFYIDRHEVTNAQFERFVRTTGHRTAAEREGSGWAYQQQGGRWQWNQVNGAQWRNPNGPGSSASPDHPVVQVSWNDADAYCRWAGKRLPTEAEWEKAARGTDGRRYPWGEDWDATKANGHMTVGTTRSVGSYPGGASPYGASDMAGNAHEWVADWLDESYYQSSPVRNPTGPSSGQDRVLRGGSWDAIPFYLRTSFRGSVPPNFRYNYIGFRCGRGL